MKSKRASNCYNEIGIMNILQSYDKKEYWRRRRLLPVENRTSSGNTASIAILQFKNNINNVSLNKSTLIMTTLDLNMALQASASF